MKFSKKVMIIKRLVEEALLRDRRLNPDPQDHDADEIRMCLTIMGSLIPQPRLYVIADNSLMARDFAKVMGKPYLHINEPQKLKGLSDCSVVILRTGARTLQQRTTFEAIQFQLCVMADINVWTIGEWR